MDEVRDDLIRAALIRETLRDGLREEAAPISRRLAEVKGLSNNAIGRLERLEATIESERHARIDDLALLVDLLTDGWRALNARLERIETLLGASPQQAARPQASSELAGEIYRLPTADAG